MVETSYTYACKHNLSVKCGIKIRILVLLQHIESSSNGFYTSKTIILHPIFEYSSCFKNDLLHSTICKQKRNTFRSFRNSCVSARYKTPQDFCVSLGNTLIKETRYHIYISMFLWETHVFLIELGEEMNGFLGETNEKCFFIY